MHLRVVWCFDAVFFGVCAVWLGHVPVLLYWCFVYGMLASNVRFSGVGGFSLLWVWVL